MKSLLKPIILLCCMCLAACATATPEAQPYHYTPRSKDEVPAILNNRMASTEIKAPVKSAYPVAAVDLINGMKIELPSREDTAAKRAETYQLSPGPNVLHITTGFPTLFGYQQYNQGNIVLNVKPAENYTINIYDNGMKFWVAIEDSSHTTVATLNFTLKRNFF